MNFTPHFSSSAGNLYSVGRDGNLLLMEAGVHMDKIKKAVSYDFRQIRGVLITHAHKDHAKSAGELIRNGVKVYMSEGCSEELEIDGARILEPLKTVDINGWKVLPFEVEHDAREPFGYIIARGSYKLLFLMDTGYLRYRFKNLTEIAIECNYSETLLDGANKYQVDRLERYHMSLETLLEMLKANDLSKLRRIYLCHLSDRHSDEYLFTKKVMKATGKNVLIAPKEAKSD